MGIPAELLRRRPDVRRAELEAASQSALIGVAETDLYPRLALLGSIGLRSSDSSRTRNGSSDFGDLFDSDSVEFFGGPSFTWNIFNYGRIKNSVRVQDARFEQLVVNYQNTVLRAAQEGIVFALNYGLGIMRQAGVQAQKVRAGHANMFLSPLFGEAFATVTQSVVELYNTDGSQGAARGAGIGAGIYKNQEDAFVGLKPVKTIEPNEKLAHRYQKAYNRWENVLKQQLR